LQTQDRNWLGGDSERHEVRRIRSAARGFKARDKELHQRLGLWGERLCSQVSVLDRDDEYYRPGAFQEDDWRRCHEARLALMEAAWERGLIAANPPSTSRTPRATELPERLQ
jgi:hypothetical protein